MLTMKTRRFLLAAAILFGCAEISEDLNNEMEGASSSGAGLHGQSSSSGGAARGSSSSAYMPEPSYNLECGAVTDGIVGQPATKPTVQCDGAAVAAADVTWQAGDLSWNNPEEGEYAVKAIADCGGLKSAECPGALTISPPGGILICDAVPQEKAAGLPVAKPTVKCDGAEVAPAGISWQAGGLNWDNPAKGEYTGIRATANCEGSKTAECQGALKVVELACAPEAQAVTLPAKPQRPQVTCGDNAISGASYATSLNWDNPSPVTIATAYAVTAQADCGGSPQTAVCGEVTINPAPSSNSASGLLYINDTRDNKTYRTVLIGAQRWMAENLNYNAEGSYCYDNLESNCHTYGRLYDWATAKTVCPSGWRLPAIEDWDALAAFIESDNGCTDCDGKHLKAESGWNDYQNGLYSYESGNGLDSYGFAALPGGTAYFFNAGDFGYWWSSSENGSDEAYCRIFPSIGYAAYWFNDDKRYFYSVRCLKN